MSSILKALQKLESTSTQQAKGRRLTGSPTIRPAWPWRVVPICLAFFFVIIASGFFLINRPINGLKSIPHMDDTGKPETRVLGPAVRSGPVRKKIPVSHMEKQTIQDDIKLETPGRMDPMRQTAQATGGQIARQSPQTASSDSVIMPAHTGKPVTQNKKKDTAIPRAARQVDKISTTPDIPLIDASILNLQAISWSPIPKNRITVINNRILREKSAIEGYAIILIDQDSVIVEKDAEKGKLVFK